MGIYLEVVDQAWQSMSLFVHPLRNLKQQQYHAVLFPKLWKIHMLQDRLSLGDF